jgi:hypothetical protein
MIRPALAAGGMAVVLGLLPVWPFLVTVAVGVVSYTVLVFLVGAIRPSELTEAWRLRSLSTVPDKGC